MLNKSVLMFFLFPLFSYAQENNHKLFFIKGIVIDSSTSIPLKSISVTLQNANKKSIKVNLTDAEGKFQFYSKLEGKELISVSSVGYNPITVDLVKISKKIDDTLYLQLSLTEKQNYLSEVKITRQKPLISYSLDKIAYNALMDTTNKGLNGLEILQKAPLIELDQNNQIQVLGKSNVKILIDGKEINTSSGNSSYLKALKYEMIDKIEINNQPSVKYRQEGIEKVINIITNKKLERGIYASLASGLNTRLGLSKQASVFARLSKFYFVADAALDKFGENKNSKSFQTIEDLSGIEQTIASVYDTKGNTFLKNLEVTYNGDNNESIRFLFNGFKLKNENLYQSISFTKNQLETFNRNQTYNQSSDINYGQIDYEKTLKNNQLFSFSMQLKQNDQTQFLSETNVKQKSASNEYALQADYSNTFGKAKFDFGSKYIIRKISNSELDNYTQNVVRVYSSFAYNLNKKNRVTGGLIFDNALFSNHNVNQEFTNFLPFINYSLLATKTSSLNIELNKQVKRPSLNYIAPANTIAIPGNLIIGNSNLKPENIYAIQVQYNTFILEKPFNFSLYLNSISNSISEKKEIIREDLITSYNNEVKDLNYGFSIYYSYPILKKLTVRVSGNLGWHKLSNNSFANNDGIEYKIFPTISYKMPWKIQTQLRFFLYSKIYSQQGYSGYYSDSQLSIAKNLVSDKLNLRLTVYQPFIKTQDVVSKYNISNLIYTNTNVANVRYINFQLTYDMGDISKSMNRKNSKGKRISNDDIK